MPRSWAIARTSSAAANPVSVTYGATIDPRTTPSASSGDRYLPVRNPAASPKYGSTPSPCCCGERPQL